MFELFVLMSLSLSNGTDNWVLLFALYLLETKTIKETKALFNLNQIFLAGGKSRENREDKGKILK